MGWGLYDDGPTFDIRNRPFIFLSHGVQSGRTYKFRFSFLIANSLSKTLALSSQRLSVCCPTDQIFPSFSSSVFFSSEGQFFPLRKISPFSFSVFSSSPCIADISHNHTTGGGVLFRAGVLFSIENAYFFLRIYAVLMYFLQAWIMRWCTKIDKYQVCLQGQKVLQSPPKCQSSWKKANFT